MSEAIGGRISMFNPYEWTKTDSTRNGSYIYINNQTKLPKLRNSFSREQQHKLDQYSIGEDVKLWVKREYKGLNNEQI